MRQKFKLEPKLTEWIRRDFIENLLDALLDALDTAPGGGDEHGDGEWQGDGDGDGEGSVVHLDRCRQVDGHRHGHRHRLLQTLGLGFLVARMRLAGDALGHHHGPGHGRLVLERGHVRGQHRGLLDDLPHGLGLDGDLLLLLDRQRGHRGDDGHRRGARLQRLRGGGLRAQVEAVEGAVEVGVSHLPVRELLDHVKIVFLHFAVAAGNNLPLFHHKHILE